VTVKIKPLPHKETFKEDRRESLSDRRLKKVIELLCISAATNGRSEVDLSDVFLLKDCLWNNQDNALKVRDLILNTLRSFSRSVPQGEGTIKAPPTPIQISSKLGTVVKGFKGSGTEQDPLLIQTIEDLMSLSHPDVGSKGYQFRQTANIDCSSLSFWTNISFKGNYDGGGYTITNKTLYDLFSIIQEQSNITNLKLENLRLTATAHISKITYCSSNLSLIKNNATKCIITACESGDSLIYGDAIDCTIKNCKSNSFLINKNSINSTITDCLSVINSSLRRRDDLSLLGGIAKNLTKGSVVERCFVMGSIKNPDSGEIHFSGIAGECSDSTISHCAVGKLTLIGQNVNWQRRITGPKPITHFNGVWSAKFITQTTNTSNTNTSTLKK
jgi:MoxR-like ATPase